MSPPLASRMLSPDLYRAAFARALPFDQYLATAKPHERSGWDAFARSVTLTPAQIETVRALERRINLLCISGTWCGDCVQQVPILAEIQRAFPAPADQPDAPGIDLRLIDRDADRALSGAHMICGGMRVPVMIFLTEEFDFAALAGDRSLTRYRALLHRNMGPACMLPGARVEVSELDGTTQDWVNEFERVGIMLRLSGKLRQKHAD